MCIRDRINGYRGETDTLHKIKKRVEYDLEYLSLIHIFSITPRGIPMSEFNDRFAVVTGASSGIGLKLTETLLGHGATVLAMARREGPPESLHAHSGKRLHWLAGDVTRERDLDALASRAASIGPVDYLVPNAGIAQLADGLDLSLIHISLQAAPLQAVPAVQAGNATQATMLAAGWAGERVVAVGDHGVVLLSDDQGRQWRQARSVPLSCLLYTSRCV